MDRSCVEVCSVGCLYEGARKFYVNPDECVDGEACEAVCSVGAIVYEDGLDDSGIVHLGDNRQLFRQILPCREAPLGDHGGGHALGPVGVDTPLVSALPEAPPD